MKGKQITYSEIAEAYDKLLSDPQSPAMVDPEDYGHRKHSLFLLKLLAVPFDSNKKLLDVACGGGGFLYYAEQMATSCGIDISPVGIRRAKTVLKRAKVEVGKAEALSHPDNEFDFVTCIGSLEHFLDMDRALQEMRRVLKEDGKLLIEVPNLYFLGDIVWVWLTGAHIGWKSGKHQPIERADTIKGWQQLIEKHGFKVIKVAGYNGRFPLKTLLKPSLKNLLRFMTQFGCCIGLRNLAHDFVYVAQRSN